MSPLARAPLDLGRLDALDPFELEPGVILWERFCVVGPVKHMGQSWSAPVTDLQRHFGRATHHRLELLYLPLRGEGRTRLRKAIIADGQVQPRVHAMLEMGLGTAMVVEPVQGSAVGGPVAETDAPALAAGLAGLRTRLHDGDVTGIRFHPGDLRQRAGRFCVRTFEHLAGGDSTAAEDVAQLTQLLTDLAPDHLGSLVNPPPASAHELWDRARALHGEETPAAAEILAEPPFVGREEQLAQMMEAYGRARVAQSSVILLRGERGVGKSRLIKEFGTLVARSFGALLLEGEYLQDCGETRGGLAEALDQLAATLRNAGRARKANCDRLRRATEPFTRVLTDFAPGLVDVLGEAPEPPTIELDEEFVRHTAVLADAVGAVGSKSEPLVLVLENMEAADRGTLAVLQKLLAVDKGHHLVVVLSLRGDTPEALTDDRIKVIDLEPLTTTDLEECLDHVLPGTLDDSAGISRALHDASEGYPLAAFATIGAWLEQRTLTRDGPKASWHLTETDDAHGVSDLYAYRLGQLSADGRELALLSSLRGGLANPDWLDQVTGWPRERLVTAIDGLVLAGFMLRDQLGRLRFVHGSVREMVADAASAEARASAHTQIAAWLERQGPATSAAQRAYHLEESSGASSSSKALVALHLVAGREMLRIYDLDRARWHYERALIGDLTDDERVTALEGCADAAVLAGEVDEARDRYMAASAATPDPVRRTRIAAKGLHALYAKAATDQAYEVATVTLKALGQPLRSSAPAKVGSILWALARVGAKPRGVAPEFRDALCYLYSYVVAVLLFQDPMNVATGVLRAARLARGQRSGEAAFSMAFFALVRAMAGHVEAARTLLDEAEEIATEVDNAFVLAGVHHIRGHTVELPYGEYEAGQRSLDLAIETYRSTGDFTIAGLSFMFKILYARDREPASKVLGWLDEAAGIAKRQGNQVAIPELDALRTLILARQGDANVIETAAEVSDRIESARALEVDRLLAHTYLAMALVEAGEPELAAREIEMARSHKSPLPSGEEPTEELHFATGLVELARRDFGGKRVRRVRKCIRALRKAGRRSPRLRAEAMFLELRVAITQGRLPRATAMLGELVATLPTHGQAFYVAEAHTALSQALKGKDVLAAKEHGRLAGDLYLSMELSSTGPTALPASLDTPGEPPLPLAPSGPISDSREILDVSNSIQELREDLANSLDAGVSLYMNAESDLDVFTSPTELQALLVHMVLTVRDAVVGPSGLSLEATSVSLDQAEAADISGGSSGEFARVRAAARGATRVAPIIGGLSACRQQANRLGGFLAVSQDGQELAIDVYIPASDSRAPRSREVVALESVLVVHEDARTTRTLVSAMSRLGYECNQAHPDSILLPRDDRPLIVFASGETLRLLVPQIVNARWVEIVARNQAPNATFPSLQVPFALGELEAVLSDVAGDSSETEARPG